MDTSRFKRREIQTRRQTAKRLYGVSEIVPRVESSRPQIDQSEQPPDGLSNQIEEPIQYEAVQPQTPVLNDTPQIQEQPEAIVTYPDTQQPAVNESAEAGQWQSSMPIDMNLPGAPSPMRTAKTVVRTGRLMTGRRLAFRAVALLLILIIGAGGLLFSQGYMTLRKTFKGGATTAAALTVNVNPSLLKGEGDGRVNILLLGRGGGTHDGPDLTDTMMLASIDPVNHQATLLSIPRDLWIDIPNQGAMKINAAWETGEFNYLGKIETGSTNQNAIQAGFNEVDQTVESVLGVPIDYNMLLDFQAFQQAVNTVNGVTVDVPTDLVDPTMAWENNNNPILAKAGIQTFDGAEALNYVRSRETTSDFARAQRQRAVLVALKNKVETLGILSNPLKIDSLFNTFGNNVATDLSLADATRLYSIISDIGSANVASVGMADSPNNYITTGNLDGQSIDLPTAGLFNYSAIQTFVRGQLKDPYIIKENAKILVLNGTTTPGLATSNANELESYGYNVIGVANTPTSSWTNTTIVDLSHGKDKYTAHYLQQRYNVTPIHTLPDNTIQTNGADFVIIIGSDETTPTQN